MVASANLVENFNRKFPVTPQGLKLIGTSTDRNTLFVIIISLYL